MMFSEISSAASLSSLPLDLVREILKYMLTPINLIMMRASSVSWMLYKLFADCPFTYYTHILFYEDKEFVIFEVEHTPFNMVIRYARIGCQKITLVRQICCHYIRCGYEINVEHMTHEQIMQHMNLYVDNVSSAGATYHRSGTSWQHRMVARSRAKMMAIEQYLFDYNVEATVVHSRNAIVTNGRACHRRRDMLIRLRHNSYTRMVPYRNAAFWHWGMSRLLMIACGGGDSSSDGSSDSSSNDNNINTAEFFALCC